MDCCFVGTNGPYTDFLAQSCLASFAVNRLSPDNFVYREDGLAGVSFINLSLGFRLSNRNQTILQGFAFLNNYQRLCKHSQASSLSCLTADEVDS
jgi:hypothetical protein